jgi:surfactin synthase thioesterase subunit
LAVLVAALVSQSPPQPPYAFFGHSLGALVAFETARELGARGISQPVRLFASAYPAPGIPYRKPSVRDLSDEDLLMSVTSQFGDTFGAVSDNPELLASSVAAYRADFTMLETYQHAAGPPLDVPVTVCGAQDDDIDMAELAAWQSYTTAAFDLRVFPGGHFYFRDQPDELLAVISGALARPVNKRPS